MKSGQRCVPEKSASARSAPARFASPRYASRKFAPAAREVRLVQIRTLKVRLLKVRVHKVRTPKVRTPKVRTPKNCIDEIRADKVGILAIAPRLDLARPSAGGHDHRHHHRLDSSHRLTPPLVCESRCPTPRSSAAPVLSPTFVPQRDRAIPAQASPCVDWRFSSMVPDRTESAIRRRLYSSDPHPPINDTSSW